MGTVWLAFWAVKVFFLKYRYDNDLWTITDQRIIDSFRSSPFSLKITTADLVDIVDTSLSRSGLLPTLFNYGDIRCETAGERQQFGADGSQRAIGGLGEDQNSVFVSHS